MARFKDFGAPKSSTTEPIHFKLYDEDFEAVPQIQGKLLISLVADSQGEDAAKSAAIILSFFESVLTDESWTRFDALLSSKTKNVDVETLAEITGWLVEEYTSRPEAQPEA